MPRKRFRVTVKAVDASNAESDVGELIVDAKDRDDATQKVLAQLWTPELEASGKKPSDIYVAPRMTQYAPSKYDVVDAGGSYRLSPTWTLAAYVTNLFDKKYWRWSDVQGAAGNAAGLAVVDAFTAPGRAVQVSLRADF